MSKSKPFTADNWEGLAGCTSWENGEPPIYRALSDDREVVCDSTGIQVTEYCGDEDPIVHDLLVGFPNQTAAIAFIDLLPVDFDPSAFGFRRI